MLLAIERSGAKTLLLDITGVPAVDHEVAHSILVLAQAARVMGARVMWPVFAQKLRRRSSASGSISLA